MFKQRGNKLLFKYSCTVFCNDFKGSYLGHFVFFAGLGSVVHLQCRSLFCFFLKLTKIHLEAQKVEQELRDELSNSVSKAVSDADRRQIMDLEKREMELKVEVSK